MPWIFQQIVILFSTNSLALRVRPVLHVLAFMVLTVTMFFPVCRYAVSEEGQASRELHYAYSRDSAMEVAPSWVYFGPIGLNNFIFENFGLGYSSNWRFFEDKYNFAHKLSMKIMNMPKNYSKSNEKMSRYFYNAKLTTDRIDDHWVFLTNLEFFRERWGEDEGINFRLKATPLGIEFLVNPGEGFFSSMKLKMLALGYWPTYQYENFNKYSTVSLKWNGSSAEFFSHSFHIGVGFQFSSQFMLNDTFAYSMIKNIKNGESSSDYTELTNTADFLYFVTKQVSIYYRNEYVSQGRRKTAFGIDKNSVEQSINIAYIF
ncbi:MAG: hypothetical protein HQK53_03885 [Oligoflexia bacterium]|nr:hypothetical protein [Oligoflexia bacterium]